MIFPSSQDVKKMYQILCGLFFVENIPVKIENKKIKPTLHVCYIVKHCLFIVSLKQIYLYLLVHLDQRQVQVNYCHHLASVVCKLFTFQASSPKSQGQLEPNLVGMFLGWSSTKFLFFVPFGYSTWLPGPIICSDWLKFQRSSSLKLMN